jgi:hypothetical protein
MAVGIGDHRVDLFAARVDVGGEYQGEEKRAVQSVRERMDAQVTPLLSTVFSPPRFS